MNPPPPTIPPERPARSTPSGGVESLPMRCAGCGYVLENLPDDTHACPECGGYFDRRDVLSFTRDASMDWWRAPLPWVLLAVICGTVYAVSFYALGHLGWGLFLGVPFALGAALAYALQVSAMAKWLYAVWGWVLLVLVVFSFGLMGPLCGIIFLIYIAIVGTVGVGVGTLIAVVLRERLRSRAARAWRTGGLLLLWLVPGALHVAESATWGRPRVESVSTAVVLHANPQRAYHGWLFYEQVDHPRPLLLRLGLPAPLGTRGRIAEAGDVQVCVYERGGRLVKRATRVEPGRLLAFDVIEQQGVEDRSVRLIDGSFAFDAVEGEGRGVDRTRVTLTTRYEPKLTPRWLWRPMERRVARTLHAHVLEGMRGRLADPVKPAMVSRLPDGSERVTHPVGALARASAGAEDPSTTERRCHRRLHRGHGEDGGAS